MRLDASRHPMTWSIDGGRRGDRGARADDGGLRSRDRLSACALRARSIPPHAQPLPRSGTRSDAPHHVRREPGPTAMARVPAPRSAATAPACRLGMWRVQRRRGEEVADRSPHATRSDRGHGPKPPRSRNHFGRSIVRRRKILSGSRWPSCWPGPCSRPSASDRRRHRPRRRPSTSRVSATVQTTPTFGLICDDCAPDVAFGGDNVGLGARVTHLGGGAVEPDGQGRLPVLPVAPPPGSDARPRRHADRAVRPALGHLPRGRRLRRSTSIPVPVTSRISRPMARSTALISRASISRRVAQARCTLQLVGDGSYDCHHHQEHPHLQRRPLRSRRSRDQRPGHDDDQHHARRRDDVRTITAAGSTVKGPDTLQFDGPTPSVVCRPGVSISCTAPAGSNALYDLASTESDPTLVAKTDVSVTVEITIILTFGGTVHVATFGPGSPTKMHLTAPSNQVDLGPILPNNIPPAPTPVVTTPATRASRSTSTAPGRPRSARSV